MPSDKSPRLARGSKEHAEALQKVKDHRVFGGLANIAYKEATEELKALQNKINWQPEEGVVPSDGVGRKLCLQTLPNRFCFVDEGKGELLTWPAIKQRLISQPLGQKEQAGMFLLSKFYSDGFARQSFPKGDYDTLIGSISRCGDNVEWVDGL